MTGWQWFTKKTNIWNKNKKISHSIKKYAKKFVKIFDKMTKV